MDWMESMQHIMNTNAIFSLYFPPLLSFSLSVHLSVCMPECPYYIYIIHSTLIQNFPTKLIKRRSQHWRFNSNRLDLDRKCLFCSKRCTKKNKNTANHWKCTSIDEYTYIHTFTYTYSYKKITTILWNWKRRWAAPIVYICSVSTVKCAHTRNTHNMIKILCIRWG